MGNEFRSMFESLKQTAEGLVQLNEGLMQANEGLMQSNEGIKKAIDAAVLANVEHEDLRETVHRLEALVMQQAAKIQELEKRLN